MSSTLEKLRKMKEKAALEKLVGNAPQKEEIPEEKPEKSARLLVEPSQEVKKENVKPAPKEKSVNNTREEKGQKEEKNNAEDQAFDFIPSLSDTEDEPLNVPINIAPSTHKFYKSLSNLTGTGLAKLVNGILLDFKHKNRDKIAEMIERKMKEDFGI